MTNNTQINETWLKASVLGSSWAASEIVLGSFLHNLRIPFSGNILTAIGLIILISASYKWKNKGLFWKSGLICAIMKSMSPSAVIFGPMIAIFAEALFLEISTKILGRNILGFFVGASIAMSWVLVQRISNFIIFYGFNIVELYSNLMQFAEKQLHTSFNMVWAPIVFLLIINVLTGLIAVFFGIKVGKAVANKPLQLTQTINLKNNVLNQKIETINNFGYSLYWLIFTFLVILTSFLLISYTHWYIWFISTPLLITIWTFRYKNAIRQILRPKFWLFFGIISLLTAYIFTKMQSNPKSLEEAFFIGMQMNFRAAIIVVGFSVIGKELYNPRIRNFFNRTAFKNLPFALETAFETLPIVIENLPDIKHIIKNPISTFQILFAVSDYRLNELLKKKYNSKIYILKGEIDEGKTSFLLAFSDFLKAKHYSTNGFVSKRILLNTKTVGYSIYSLKTQEKEQFLTINENNLTNKIGKFYILPKGLEKGESILKTINPKEIVIIDEIGKLELNEKGWYKQFNDIVENSQNTVIISVRNKFVEDVKLKWNLSENNIFDVSTTTHTKLLESILGAV
jgi:nucleoside-triphosphatase THEP1